MRISIFIVLLLFVGLIGVLPDSQIPIWSGQEILLEHAVIILIALLVVKHPFKLFLIWISINTFFRYGKWSMLAFHTVTFFLVFASVLDLKRKYFPVVLNSICVIALMQVGWMALQHFNIDPIFKPIIEGNLHLCGFLGNSNVTGACLGLAFPLFLRRRWWVCLPFIFLGFKQVHSTMAVLTALAGVLFIFCYIYPRLKRRIIALALIGILLVGVFYMAQDDFQRFLQSGRLECWVRAWPLIKEHPFMGYGIGHWKVVYVTYEKQLMADGFIPYGDFNYFKAHNDWYQLIFETGFTGLFIVLSGFIYLFIKYLKQKKDWIMVLIGAGVFATMFNSLGNFLFQTPVGVIGLIYIVMLNEVRK